MPPGPVATHGTEFNRMGVLTGSHVGYQQTNLLPLTSSEINFSTVKMPFPNETRPRNSIISNDFLIPLAVFCPVRGGHIFVFD